MTTKDLDYFLEHGEEFDNLSAEDRAKVIEGGSIEGEISSVPPDAAATEPNEEPVESPAEGVDDPPEPPIVLARDGKHVIPFEELQTAREQARYWQAKAEEALAQQQQPQPQPDTTPRPSIDLKELRRQLREADLLGEEDRVEELQEQIDAEVMRRAEEVAYQRVALRELETQQAAIEKAVMTVANAAIGTYPFLDHNGPEANQEAITQVQALSALYAGNGHPADQALSMAVEKVAQWYAQPASPAGRNNAVSAKDIELKASAAIAKARTATPNSMSAIPSASVPHHDEAEALLDMSPVELYAKFHNKSPEQIEALVSRLL